MGRFYCYAAANSRPKQHTLEVSGHRSYGCAAPEFNAVSQYACDAVNVHFRWRPQLTDPADELVLEAAINGQARMLVTHNIRDFAAASPQSASIYKSSPQSNA